MRSAKILRLAGAAALLAAGAASAVPMYGTTAANQLVTFDSATPGTATSIPITGLQMGETVVGIDQRPANGSFYALGSTGRLYLLNVSTGAAIAISATPVTLTGTAFGFDFNPTVDRIRVISDADQNLRLNPDTGGVAATDTNLQYAATDVNALANPNAVGAAYTNNFLGATSTVLYDIDSNLDILVRQDPPNSGTLNTVGALGVDTTAVLGFDVTTQGTAFAVLEVGGVSGLYTINLTTGAATLVGATGVNGITAVTAGGAIPGAIGIGAIPTLSQWGMIAMAGVLGLLAFFGLRRRSAA
jgi:hypothetical protein